MKVYDFWPGKLIQQAEKRWVKVEQFGPPGRCCPLELLGELAKERGEPLAYLIDPGERGGEPGPWVRVVGRDGCSPFWSTRGVDPLRESRLWDMATARRLPDGSEA